MKWIVRYRTLFAFLGALLIFSFYWLLGYYFEGDDPSYLLIYTWSPLLPVVSGLLIGLNLVSPPQDQLAPDRPAIPGRVLSAPHGIPAPEHEADRYGVSFLLYAQPFSGGERGAGRSAAGIYDPVCSGSDTGREGPWAVKSENRENKKPVCRLYGRQASFVAHS